MQLNENVRSMERNKTDGKQNMMKGKGNEKKIKPKNMNQI